MRNQHYPRKLRSQLRHWQDKVDRLRQRMNDAGEDTRLELENRIEDLHAKQKAAREKLAQLDRAGSGSERSISVRLQRFFSRFRGAARRWLSGSR